ncbi:hypothetical protein ACSQ67_016835 [Phaseolus vulgaris]
MNRKVNDFETIGKGNPISSDRPEEESFLAVVPINNLIPELIELRVGHSVVGRTLGEELERTTTMVIPKLKTQEGPTGPENRGRGDKDRACQGKGVLPSRPSSSDLVSWRYDIEKDVVEGKLVPGRRRCR